MFEATQKKRRNTSTRKHQITLIKQQRPTKSGSNGNNN